MSKLENFLPAKYRTVEPASLADVRREVSLIREPRETGYYIDNDDWPTRRVGPYQQYGHFQAGRALRGEAESMTRGETGRYATGQLGTVAIAHMTIKETGFTYDATEEAEEGRLQVISAGVLKYLQGYDQAESDDLQEQVADAIAEDNRRHAVVTRWRQASMPGLMEATHDVDLSDPDEL